MWMMWTVWNGLIRHSLLMKWRFIRAGEIWTRVWRSRADEGLDRGSFRPHTLRSCLIAESSLFLLLSFLKSQCLRWASTWSSPETSALLKKENSCVRMTAPFEQSNAAVLVSFFKSDFAILFSKMFFWTLLIFPFGTCLCREYAVHFINIGRKYHVNVFFLGRIRVDLWVCVSDTVHFQ